MLDYTNRHFGHKKSDKPRTSAEDQGWWVAPIDPEDDMECCARAASLINTARELENVQREIHEQNLMNAQMYSNRQMVGFEWGTGQMSRASMAPISKVSENIMVTVVDTLTAQIGKNRPKATPVSRGASWNVRRQAKKLDKFLYGEFLRNRVYDKGKKVFRNACIFSFGCAHVSIDQDNDDEGEKSYRVNVESVFPDEILVDNLEVAATGKIQHIYRRRVLPKSTVAAMFNVDEREFDKDVSYVNYRSIGAGYVVVVEGWSLPKGKTPGRYVCATPSRLLKDEPWDESWVPFVFYQVPTSGFYCPSAVEQALNYQIRLNEINDVIRDAQDLMSRPRIFIQEGSRVNPMELDNRIGRIIKYTGGQPPTAATWNAVSAELYNERDRQYSQCLAQFGLNQLSASGQLPGSARLDSSAGMREYNNIQDDRLSDSAQRFERFYLDLAEMMIKVLHCGAESRRVCKTTWYSGGKRSRIESINWAEIDLDDSAYTLQLEASSIFNMTPAAARDSAERDLAMGLITAEEYRELISNPDIESFTSLQTAAKEDLNRVQEKLENGVYEEPDGVQDLVGGITQMQMAYLNLKRYEGDDGESDVPPEVFAVFLDWLVAAQSVLDQAAEADNPTPPAAAMPGAMPGGMPMPGPGQPGMPMNEALQGSGMPPGMVPPRMSAPPVR
jgi:hypothetical protein